MAAEATVPTTSTEPKVPETVQAKPVSDDPFAAQRGGDDPFAQQKLDSVAGGDDMAAPDGKSPDEKPRRMSREWDASKVPPSQFQKRKGSIYSTPGSRDGHVKGKGQYQAYFEKLKEKGWDKLSSSKPK